ncbi:hypothetical protein Hypma_007489 [Hypsizygus marmoreus]|uniref:Protein kinase domain-containing protein n=1 Tax=Hypsizygus marmoreus TaxID=39966 RepID=A0A369JXE3_HYPMA|nr:hypothetical protein Hypma_007489 [Hypsizygus marmoreus]
MSEKTTETRREERLAKMEAETYDVRDGKLAFYETFWRDHQPWLKERGYTLRARYQPDWVASWKQDPSKSWSECEDSVGMYTIMDAVRDDGKPVALKLVDLSRHSEEAAIGRLFSSAPLAGHSSNYCLPILDVLLLPDDDDSIIIVMPFLYDWDTPSFETIGEIVEFFRQLFEGLNFMHQNLVCHGDIKYNNVMADSLHLYKSPPHPGWPHRAYDMKSSLTFRSSRTQTPVKYFLVDFGLSQRYKKEDALYLTAGNWGAGDKTVPEFHAHEDSLCDPFAVDVYCMGNIIRENFLGGGEPQEVAKKGFDFMHELVADMVQDDPKARPTMDQVVSRFNDIVLGLSTWKLRGRVASVDERRVRGTLRSIAHWTKQLRFMARRIPAIPRA